MSSLMTLKINLEKIDKSKIYQGKKGKYLEVTVAVNNDADDYGNNVSAWIGQTTEERASGEAKQYLGNGKVFWTDGNVNKSESKEVEADTDDLPF